MVSDWGESVPVVSEDRGAYVADAADPLRTWVRVAVRSQSSRVEHQNRVVSWGKGDQFPTVWSEPEQGDVGGVVFYAATSDDVAALYDVLRLSRTLMLRDNAEVDGAEVVQPPTRWVAQSNPFTPDRVGDLPLASRFVTVEWVEQPVVGLGASSAPVTSPVLWD